MWYGVSTLALVCHAEILAKMFAGRSTYYLLRRPNHRDDAEHTDGVIQQQKQQPRVSGIGKPGIILILRISERARCQDQSRVPDF